MASAVFVKADHQQRRMVPQAGSGEAPQGGYEPPRHEFPRHGGVTRRATPRLLRSFVSVPNVHTRYHLTLALQECCQLNTWRYLQRYRCSLLPTSPFGALRWARHERHLTMLSGATMQTMEFQLCATHQRPEPSWLHSATQGEGVSTAHPATEPTPKHGVPPHAGVRGSCAGVRG
jgi:hypothetical protein